MHQRITLSDIADQAGVSTATVSRVLNGKSNVAEVTRRQVLVALDLLGYERPETLRQVSKGLVGLVIPELSNPIFPMFAQEIEQLLASSGHTPLLCTQTPGGTSEDEYIEMLVERGVAGIIFVSGRHADTSGDVTRYQRLRERGVPLVTVLFMANVMLPLFLPPQLHIDNLMRALIGVALFASAYMAEVVRGGLQAIPRGQFEAADSLGLGYWAKMRLIILPQALTTVIPGITNTFVGLFKDTTLVSIIGLYDFLGIVHSAGQDPAWLGHGMEGYAFCALVYFLLCYGMSHTSYRIERHFTPERA